MKEKLFSSLKYLLFFAFGALIMYLILKDHNLKNLLQNIKSADYRFLLASMIFGYAAYVFRGVRWLLLINAMKYKTSASLTTHSIAVGYFANAIFPRAGEIVRCTSLFKVTGIPVNKLFGTILLERAIDLVMLLLFICLSLILKFEALFSFFSTLTKKGAEEMFYEFFLGTFFFLTIVFILVFLFKNQIKKSLLAKKIFSLWLGVKEGFQIAFYMKKKGAFLLYTLLIWLMYLMMTYICFFSLTETSCLSIVDGLYITVVGGLGMIVPVQGGMGPYHAAVTMGAVGIGLPEVTGVTMAVLIHSTQSIMIILAGIIATIVLSFAKSKKEDSESVKPS